MPKPAYIVCSMSGSIDQATNRPSAYHIVETLKATEVEKSDSPLTAEQKANMEKCALKLRVLAAWIKEKSDDAEAKYEGEITASHIAYSNGQSSHLSRAYFGEINFRRLIHRLAIAEMPLPVVGETGFIEVVNRIKPLGASEWSAEQTFRLVIEEVVYKESVRVAKQPDAVAQS